MLRFLSGKNIVVLGLQPWDIEIGSNCKNIALELSRSNRVLYVNRALDRLSLLKFRNHPRIKNRLDSIRGHKPDLEKVNENLWSFNPRTIVESFTRIPFKPVFEYFNLINNKRIAKEIERACGVLGFERPVIFVDNDFFRASRMKSLIQNELFIYYIRDYLVNQRHFKPHGSRMEQELISKADIVATNSVYLQKYAAPFNSRSHFIGQGFDAELFENSDNLINPSDLKNIPGPVIGYVGFITVSRLDQQLIYEIAKSRPEWSIVLVGPEDEYFVKSSLHDMDNVFFLGHKDKKELPAYIKHFDVCLNPQLKNEQTEGNYPLKIDEYLSLGKPVVATRTEAMEMFSNHTYLATGLDEYILKIELALSEKDKYVHERTDFAKAHTWAQCIQNLDDVIHSLSNQKAV